MVRHAKTVLNIGETVMRPLRRVLSALTSRGGSTHGLPPLPIWRSGGFRVDVANREELYRILDRD